jgi:hypothetical protein
MRRITGDAARPIAEIDQYIRAERARWGGVVTQLGLAGSLQQSCGGASPSKARPQSRHWRSDGQGCSVLRTRV